MKIYFVVAFLLVMFSFVNVKAEEKDLTNPEDLECLSLSSNCGAWSAEVSPITVTLNQYRCLEMAILR